MIVAHDKFLSVSKKKDVSSDVTSFVFFLRHSQKLVTIRSYV